MGKSKLPVFLDPVATDLGSLSSMPPSHSSQTPLTLDAQVALSTVVVPLSLGSTPMEQCAVGRNDVLVHDIAFSAVVSIATGVIAFKNFIKYEAMDLYRALWYIERLPLVR
jgi:hypothetical protein